MNKKIVIIVSAQVFTKHEDWLTYQRSIKKSLEINPEQRVETIFYNTKMQPKKELMALIPTWPKIIVFDECHHATIKKVHNTLSRKNENIIFYAKNFGVKNHDIQGINTIEDIKVLPLHLTAIH